MYIVSGCKRYLDKMPSFYYQRATSINIQNKESLRDFGNSSKYSMYTTIFIAVCYPGLFAPLCIPAEINVRESL